MNIGIGQSDKILGIDTHAQTLDNLMRIAQREGGIVHRIQIDARETVVVLLEAFLGKLEETTGHIER